MAKVANAYTTYQAGGNREDLADRIYNIDPFDTPGVATPVRGGADYREAHLAMEMVADTGKMASFELTEINPILDVHNKTANVGMELVLSAFGKQIL